MASTKVKAIVIGGTNIKEKDKLITIFSLEQGKMVVSMKGVRGEKAKLKSAKEIFCFGDFVIEEGKFSKIVTSVDIIDNFYLLSSNIDKYYEGCAILDIINKITTDQPNHLLFIETIKALKTLCYDDVKKYYVIDKFLVNLFKNTGYAFLTDKCSCCGGTLNIKYFNFEVGEVVCPMCKNGITEQIAPATYTALRILDQTDYEKLPSVKFGGMAEVQAFNLLSKNYMFRTGYKVLDIL